MHLRLDAGAGEEDAYLKLLINSAVRSVEKETGREIGSEANPFDARDLTIVSTAVLMLVGHWYANREAVSQELRNIPLSVTWLLDLLRIWSI